MTSPDLLARSLPSSPAPGISTARDCTQPLSSDLIEPNSAQYATCGHPVAEASPEVERVKWVRDDQDATATLIKSLADSYGAGISAAVARELSLHPAPGRPLESRDVRRALEVAHTTQQAIAGVDYLTLLRHSASADSREFRSVASEMGVDATRMGRATRQKLDDALKHRFEQLGAAGRSPISPQTAREMLKEELFLLTC